MNKISYKSFYIPRRLSIRVYSLQTFCNSCTRHTYWPSSTGASYNNTVVSLSRVYLSSLVSMPLLVKTMAPEWILVVISNLIFFTVQIFESVRTRCTSHSGLSKRVRQLALHYQAKSLWFFTLYRLPHF